MKDIYILTDYRDQFYSSIKISTGGMSIEKIREYFLLEKISVRVINFSAVDDSIGIDWSGALILYQSSEDRDLFYKNYISDILVYLKSLGAILIPDHIYFHAHENKVFQSLISYKINAKNLKIPKSKVFGTLEDFKKSTSDIHYPIIIKGSEGCQSSGVMMAKNKTDLLRKAKKISSSFNIKDFILFNLKKFLKPGYQLQSLNRKKFVLQEFVPELEGDYKVLLYGNKAFVLSRKNRKNDFRASGSGIFEFPLQVPSEILESASNIIRQLNVPYISADIAYDANKKICYLLEYQFLMFGTYTIEKAPHYFEFKNNSWIKINHGVELEATFVDTILNFIEHNKIDLKKI